MWFTNSTECAIPVNILNFSAGTHAVSIQSDDLRKLFSGKSEFHYFNGDRASAAELYQHFLLMSCSISMQAL